MDFKHRPNTPIIQLGDNALKGDPVTRIERKIKDLTAIFYDKEAHARIDSETTVYEVDSYFPIDQDTEGGLFFGVTRIKPGKVGEEYFMTKGHFHEKRDRGEFYWGLEGEGLLILMEENRKPTTETIGKGSVHYIPGHVAHRVANIGKTELSFAACWPSDAGHDYATIETKGFSARAIERQGKLELVYE